MPTIIWIWNSELFVAYISLVPFNLDINIKKPLPWYMIKIDFRFLIQRIELMPLRPRQKVHIVFFLPTPLVLARQFVALIEISIFHVIVIVIGKIFPKHFVNIWPFRMNIAILRAWTVYFFDFPPEYGKKEQKHRNQITMEWDRRNRN